MKLIFIFLFLALGTGLVAMDQTQELDPAIRDLYLSRLKLSHEDIAGPKDAALLNTFVTQHLQAIPFENLTMHMAGAPKVLIDHESIINKVLKGSMGRNRGGYCYEINELFYLLLKTVGFDVTRHKAAVWAGKESGVIPEPSHQLSVVKINDDLYLADIGFGLFNIFKAVKLPQKIGQEITFEDKQGKLISFKRVLFDESFGPRQQGQEGFIYSRFSERSTRFEKISSFTLASYEADDFRGHNDFVQNNYRPFLDNIFFTRFDSEGNMIGGVRSRSECGDMEGILRWINGLHGVGSTFELDVK